MASCCEGSRSWPLVPTNRYLFGLVAVRAVTIAVVLPFGHASRMSYSAWAVVAAASLGTLGCGEDEASTASCVVARQVDACCSEPVALPLSRLESDPCMQLVSRFAEVSECPAASDCVLVACPEPTPTPPLSRVAAPGGNGSCNYADECTTDADCVVATNRDECCACPVVVPRGLIAVDPCWVPSGSAVPAACDACESTDCQACSAAPPAARCVDGGSGFRTCTGA